MDDPMSVGWYAFQVACVVAALVYLFIDLWWGDD